MKIFNVTILLLIFLFVLSSCTIIAKQYHQTFIGVSQNWSAELIQDGTIHYKNHKELKDQYEIVYNREESLTLKYIGNESDLGQLVEYTVEYAYGIGKGSRSVLEGDVIKPDEVFTHYSGGGGTSHIPKDLIFTPVSNKNSVLEVTVKWNGKEERIQLKYEE